MEKIFPNMMTGKSCFLKKTEVKIQFISKRVINLSVFEAWLYF